MLPHFGHVCATVEVGSRWGHCKKPQGQDARACMRYFLSVCSDALIHTISGLEWHSISWYSLVLTNTSKY